MSTITVSTADLLQLLSDLSQTATADPDAGAIAGVLLHTETGALDDEPGRTELLVATSTTGQVVGHAHIPCEGSIPVPMLCPIDAVKSVISVFKPAVKANKQHHVTLRREGFSVTVSEVADAALFETEDAPERLTLSFGLGNPADFPYVWPLLVPHTESPVLDHESGQSIPAVPRVDLTHPAVTPFARVARSRGAPIELYPYHQRRAVHVQIGTRYRGVLVPSSYDDAALARQPEQVAPPADIYAPERHFFESVRP
ncbi:DNA segregation ATPase FtsK/SpoIIIE, S-DNA-T family [Actinopolyspora alba]|uniref:DNA segregation ATPase FtsK/SpoIIIE, S-DNA-T family n=1 Tax=Actinopolyspora alba TaxID=673379 RepID=A0A1I2BGN2_9ACTN|nr:hypothetical protein [Actinopolyspora alba]SFE55344.1 DNA segregation ATPase FtsK/SpoIIIE, S-DNA-T family [Actinopolyspora alba]